MINSHQFFCVLLLFLSMYQIKGSTLLNITNEAISIGQQMKQETEKREIYNNRTDFDKKIEKLYNIFSPFIQKNDPNQLEFATSMLQVSASFLQKSILFKNISFNDYRSYFDEFSFMVENIVRYPREVMYDEFLRPVVGTFYWIPNIKTLRDVLTECHEILQINDPPTGQNIVTEIAKFSPFAQSQQEILILYSRNIALLDAFGYSTMQYAYALFQVLNDAIHLLNVVDQSVVRNVPWRNENVIEKMNLLESEFKERNEDTFRFVKSLVSSLPRESWNRFFNNSVDLGGEFLYYKRDFIFTTMQNVFQKYIVNEVDINSRGTCTKECRYYSQTKVYGCFDEKICAQQRTCNGNLWNCNDQINYPMNICPSNKKMSSRYNFIETSGGYYGEKYLNGNEPYCSSGLVETKSWIRGIFKCAYCTCTCDNANIEGDRYFNLRDVTSDTESNNVVINARFKIENNVIHIQIQQAKLLPEARINSSLIDWKPIDNYTIHDKQVKNGKDYHTISWHQRTMCLDQLTSPSNHVLTGVRFILKDGYLKLEIQATPFDYKTGKLASNMSYWISNNEDLRSRSELKFYRREKHILDLKSTQYFQFTTSDMRANIGQDTIPYIDLGNVHKILIDTVPLSGLGIHHNSIQEIGDLLSFNIVSYDFAPHIK